MSSEEKVLLPHHEQQNLCTTRLPYRQGRKLTAVKVYTIARESNHLLIFGVPSLNLRQETKSLFIKFGKLLQFNISTQHKADIFTETYHAQFERIHTARIAKKMLDTKNFYGGILHVCYAPELESIEETRLKLLTRHNDVVFRLKNLEKERVEKKEHPKDDKVEIQTKKLNMGVINTISFGEEIKDISCKRKKEYSQSPVISKQFKPCFVDKVKNTQSETSIEQKDIEIVDCTSVEKEVVSNIDEALNYKNFGNEVVRKVSEKPINKIKFTLHKS
ncbi:RNA-binding protein 48 [Leptidea sinapis]|uniref:RNA-binding protein 48 n=1 Tax=Leptidea sinapis TaxID=189913 RepID=UPI00212C69AC|nr:RNA-binding protein 48 [Leptidea sinapis]